MSKRWLISILAAVILVLTTTVALYGGQKRSRTDIQNDSAQQHLPSAPSCSTPVSSLEEAETLLPRINERPYKSSAPEINGVSDSAILPPGPVFSNPDYGKDLYGYRGPYYNVQAINNQVIVLSPTLYTYPLPTWKVLGLVRNQTRCPIKITKISSKLIGSNGRVLGIAETTPLVERLRPGEPAPFSITAPVSTEEVFLTEWQVDYISSEPITKNFEFLVTDRSLINERTYSLEGIVQNDSDEPLRGVSVVAAWINESGQVVYIARSIMRDFLSGKLTSALDIEYEGGFKARLTEEAIGDLLSNTKLSLWGTTK